MDVVEGFTCANDITNWTDRDTYGFRFKSVDNTAPLGPVVVPPDRVPDDARIELRVNGETEQSTSRSKFVFDVREVISEVTTYTTLERGDVVMMGTGPGVGMLEPGDEVEVEIEGIGTLAHSVREPDASG